MINCLMILMATTACRPLNVQVPFHTSVGNRELEIISVLEIIFRSFAVISDAIEVVGGGYATVTGKGGGDGDYKSRCVRWALDADNDVGPARNLQFIRYLT